MNALPDCPVCGLDELMLQSYTLENGQLHFKAVCGSCGVEFHHEKFYGYNSSQKFFEDACEKPTCNNISMTGSSDSWLCSECGAKRKKQGSEKEYSFCPDCGTEISEW